MDPENYKVKIEDGYTNDVRIYVVEKCFDGLYLMKLGNDATIEFVKLDKGAQVNQPSIHIPRAILQAIVDEAGRQGIKPQKGYLEGKLGATEKHLEDMRKLVFEEKVITGVNVGNQG